MIKLSIHENGTIVPVLAQRGARRSAILGERAGSLRVAVTAAPEKGKANAAIAALLAEGLGCRSSRIALLEYDDGERAYILAPEGLKAGDKVVSGEEAEPRLGNCLPLRRVPLGMTVHNLEMQPGRGGQLCRSAGTSATLTAREGRWAQITLPSGEVRRISSECRATIGAIGNADHMNISLGKAGRKRWMGRKPHNRGTSMNPVSHPMGGGEGRTSGGRDPCSPTGVLAKGGKTRKKRKPSNAAIIRRRRPGPHFAPK